MRSALSIEIEAPAALVFNLARDVERWPRLLPHYDSARVESRGADGSLVARFVARRPLLPLLGLALPVAWRSRTWAEPEANRLNFRHLGGATAGMAVTWRIDPADDPSWCRVAIEHEFWPAMPVAGAAWAALVERLFVRPIAGRTLASFQAIAEAVVEAQRNP